ncbi:PHP domain-containing family protein [Salix suchowensis]|nr:PHP domain-containing family protein [Salix suchowensis]
MVDDGYVNASSNGNGNGNGNGYQESPRKTKDINNNKKKKKRGGSKKKMTAEQALALKSVSEWVYLDRQLTVMMRREDKVVFELHSHSKFSDGFLSPSKLVERAHGNGVKVLALTDHDTMSGVPEATEAARRFGIKIIPGVEISTMFSPRIPEAEEPVHILAYYSSGGPARSDELEKFLANIRDGRYLRLPLKWEHVTRITGKGVAPGRLHVARAMVEAGYVENLKQAFARYLYDGGPAYSTGNEPIVEEAVQFIRETGGVAVLAHPWALKNPVAIIRRLKDAGLHGWRFTEVMANWLKCYIPVLALHDFLKVARPIWYRAIKISSRDMEIPQRLRKGLIDRCLSMWLTTEERQAAEFEAIKVKLSCVEINQGETRVPIESHNSNGDISFFQFFMFK